MVNDTANFILVHLILAEKHSSPNIHSVRGSRCCQSHPGRSSKNKVSSTRNLGLHAVVRSPAGPRALHRFLSFLRSPYSLARNFVFDKSSQYRDRCAQVYSPNSQVRVHGLQPLEEPYHLIVWCLDQGDVVCKLHGPVNTNPKHSIQPDILHVTLCQLLILAVLGLPHREPSVKHVDFLTLALFRPEQSLAFPRISQCGTRPSLLAQRAVKDDFLLVF